MSQMIPRKIALTLTGVLILGALILVYWRLALWPYESTDNSYIKAHMSSISPRESGYVKEVFFENNQRVKAGDLLLVIDDADQRAGVLQGEAEVGVERAVIRSLEMEKKVQSTRVQQQTADLRTKEAEFHRAEKDLRRLNNLVTDGAISAQTRDSAEAALKQAQAMRDGARSALEEANIQLQSLDAKIEEARARIVAIEARLETARIALGHTRIHAPIDGVIGNRNLQKGQLVRPGLIVAALIPDNDLFVEANFKETQIAAMRPGQHAEIEVDAYPGRGFEAEVVSFAPASGSEFSLLPPENATGNFTKIVRRVPVRLRFLSGVDLEGLRPGLSVTTIVRVH